VIGEIEQLASDMAALLEQSTSNALSPSERRRWNDGRRSVLERAQLVLLDVDSPVPTHEDIR
jgi:hypothetical protein